MCAMQHLLQVLNYWRLSDSKAQTFAIFNIQSWKILILLHSNTISMMVSRVTAINTVHHFAHFETSISYTSEQCLKQILSSQVFPAHSTSVRQQLMSAWCWVGTEMQGTHCREWHLLPHVSQQQQEGPHIPSPAGQHQYWAAWWVILTYKVISFNK